jgi:hypothetical protein
MTNKQRAGLLMLSLLLFSTGCAQKPLPLAPMPPQIIREKPPAALIAAVPVPELAGTSNGDLAEWALALRCAVRQGNADKLALIAWANGLPYRPGANDCQ